MTHPITPIAVLPCPAKEDSDVNFERKAFFVPLRAARRKIHSGPRLGSCTRYRLRVVPSVHERYWEALLK